VRIKFTFVVLLIAVAGTTAIPVTGQEEPLPAIQARPSVFLAVDPIHVIAQPSLADAVRANDYATFDALYRESGASARAYATLHEVWSYSMTDPIGAFYGVEMYEKLAHAYPGYARFIDDYRIVDSNGNVFYPTSETRAFLLDQALEGNSVKIVTGTPAVVAAPVVVAEAPVVVRAQPEPVAAPAPDNVGSRGVLLLVIGLFGIGILAMMLRAPRELPPSIMAPPDKVEPLRRPTPAPTQTGPPQSETTNRATGSHG
jgi:hypothetical protein